MRAPLLYTTCSLCDASAHARANRTPRVYVLCHAYVTACIYNIIFTVMPFHMLACLLLVVHCMHVYCATPTCASNRLWDVFPHARANRTWHVYCATPVHIRAPPTACTFTVRRFPICSVQLRTGSFLFTRAVVAP